MSTTSKIVFGIATVTTVATIAYIHYKQQLDREKLHAGVIRDIEIQQRRKTENLYNLQQQIELTNQLKAQQYDNNKASVT